MYDLPIYWSWKGAYIVHTGQEDAESIHYESQVNGLTPQSPRVARRH